MAVVNLVIYESGVGVSGIVESIGFSYSFEKSRFSFKVIYVRFFYLHKCFPSFCDMGGWAQQTAVTSLLFLKRQKPKSHTISLFLH